LNIRLLNFQITVLQSFVLWSGIIFSLRFSDGERIVPNGIIMHFFIAGAAAMISYKPNLLRNINSGASGLFILLYIILFVISLISAIFSNSIDLSAQRTFSIFLYGMFGILTGYLVADPMQVMNKASLMWLRIISVITILTGLTFFLGDVHLGDDFIALKLSLGAFELSQAIGGTLDLPRATGFTGNPNLYAFFCVVAGAFAVFLRNALIIGRKSFLLYSALTAFGLIMSGSMTGSAVFLMVMGLSLFTSFRSKTNFLIIFIAIGLFASVFIALVVIFSEYLPRSDLGGFKQRLASWEEIYNSSARNPFSGVGFGVSYEELLSVSGHHAAHSVYLGLFSEIGVFGLLFFVAMLGLAISSSTFLVMNTASQHSILRSPSILSAIVSFVFLIYSFLEFILMRFGFPHYLFFFITFVFFRTVKDLPVVDTHR